MEFLGQVFGILNTEPGNLVFHLALVFSVTGALQGAISQWRATGYPQARRMVLGLSLLLLGQLILFVAGGLVWQGLALPQVVLPPLDRAVMFFCLVWIVWVWAFPEPSRGGDAASVLLSLLAVAGLVLGLVARSNDATLPSYNATLQSSLWNLVSIVILVLGASLLFVRKPKNWGTGLAVLGLILLGHVLDFPLATPEADYSGVVRLFTLAAYPLLLSLPMRFPTPGDFPATRTVVTFQQKVSEARASGERASQPIRERRRYSTDPKTLQSLLTLAAETDPSKINQHIVRSLSQAMLADLCFLIYIGDDKSSLFIASGYDLIREEHLEGGLLNKDVVPMLSSAILRGRPLRLPASTTSSDLKGLGELLGLTDPGNLLNVPVNGESNIFGSILLLSPYSNRLWSADDQAFLTNITSSFVPIIERGHHINQIELERDQARHTAEEAQAQFQRVQVSNTDLNNQIEGLKSQVEQSAASDIDRQNLAKRVAELEKENKSLQSSGAPSAAQAVAPVQEDQQIENELRLTLQEVARLQNSLADANIKILELEKRPSSPLTTDQAEVIASISQELRQPMSSIIGYADLLLGESVGILGALQRKFIERIKASTERIGSLIDDLIQITTLETGLMALKPESVDLNLIIDNAMAYTSSQLREKNITLRIDIPEGIQPMHSDRESLQQILIHLLQNAGAASPVEGTVTLRARMQEEEGKEYVLLQIVDTGGGIPQDDLPRVFSRLYRADNVLIQGVGDTGVGLSIAKALTEAQGGRIWVETEQGSGSTFSVLLPLRNQPVPESPEEV